MIMNDSLILVINPGSTTSKVALFRGFKDGVEEKITSTIEHGSEELEGFEKVADQKNMRLEYIRQFMAKADVGLTSLDAVVGRGGLLKPITGGTYRVNEKMLSHLKQGFQGEHASNLGGLLAHSLAREAKAESFIVDPVVVDEMVPAAKISGSPEFERKSIFHALNQKAVARRYAGEKDVSYHDLTVIVAHMGGGISVGLHHEGEVIDVNNALAGEGPFSPNRAGTLPTLDLAMHCLEENPDPVKMKNKLVKKSGVVSYLGTNDMKEVEKRAENGDEEAELIFRAMAYQVAKEIGSLYPPSPDEPEAILLTGGIAHSDRFTGLVREKVEYIAPVRVYPGEEEMKALAQGANRVLKGEEEAKTYE